MVLSEILKETELIYQDRLEEYFSQIFSNVVLPSHDLNHHRRVWNFAKELLQSLNTNGIKIGYDIPEKLIIGCYLHDSGMAIDRGIGHGYQSMLYCRIFLEKNNLNISHFNDLLSVVENHDVKEYNMTENRGELFTVLSVSDDLDAFGLNGIYRYSEIYIERGTDLRKLGDLILKNIASRHNHFIESFGFDKQLVKKHKVRYNEVVSFFEEYNRQVKDYQFGQVSLSGNCGVIEVIASSMKWNSFSIEDIVNNGVNEEDKTIKAFFRKLKIELES